MAKYRSRLPQLGGGLFLTDGGIETSLIFLDGLELPHFAAFDLLKDAKGSAALRNYYVPYATLARDAGQGFILESPTWRASPDWGRKLGYPDDKLAEANRQSIALMAELRAEFETSRSPMVISGCVGPRGDGYDPGQVMSPEEAQAYHAVQIGAFRDADADMVTAITMTNASEAIGVVRAAQAAGMPVAISFTLETDGRLPTGQALKEAIVEVDEATAELSGLLHDQLRPSDPFRCHPRARQRVDAAHPRHPRQRLAPQPPGAERGARPRCRRSGGTGQAVPAPARQPSADQRVGRLLRH